LPTQTTLSLDYHDLAGEVPLLQRSMRSSHHRTEIAWLSGVPGPEGGHLRQALTALLFAAGERFVAIDDDVMLDARSAPRFRDGLEMSCDRDDWDFFSSDAEIAATTERADIDPIATHAQWLGRKVGSVVAAQLPSPSDWARGLSSADLLRVTADSTSSSRRMACTETRARRSTHSICSSWMWKPTPGLRNSEQYSRMPAGTWANRALLRAQEMRP
jgi:hypothetical protein